ncbi:signal peptidase I [Calidifontibacter indicus]|uniref:Signal peptidase I n=1 Tax=Calidifontibacter indicus TaxID=419650 RepID=A0A3D9UXF9_9MICO|nr:signal peptidase I [Calidifontibacter indicus]REF30664.1 signal peptidase I [Calidifontibacter indicus]
MSSDASPPSASSASPRFGSRATRRWIAVLAVLAALMVLRPVFVETYTVPSISMEPALSPGDRIVVDKHGSIHRGDLVVFVADEAFYGRDPDRGVLQRLGDFFGVRPSEHVFVKRIIGLPGERVSVDAAGTLRIDGRVQHEAYLPDGVRASTTPFTTRVPPGRYFVMGDNRGASDDSRNHLGDPGGGSVRASDVIGDVVWRYWPKDGWGSVDHE